MDLRIEKTEKAIKNAFLELRARNALEKITVKKLCEMACINKSTFYSHYADIYALSDALEAETVASILSSIANNREYTMDNLEILSRDIALSFLSNRSLTSILFSDREAGKLITRIEIGVKDLFYEKYPQFRNDIRKNIILSYCIQGAYHAFLSNPDADTDIILSVIQEIAAAIKDIP